MACKTSYELRHNFPKLADEAGFTFNTHRPKIRIDWNRIKLLDVDSLIKDRKFILLEQHLNDVLDCVLESEFDVRILDEGVAKMFRLAQLTVEYQQFCRHYLDRSIFVLRDELTSVVQVLESTKKSVRDKEDEIRKLKRKSKHNYRPPLYGNDNIANMILKTLSTRGDLFSLKPVADTAPQYNKCSHCDKIFLNQLYLKSHLQRRHAIFLEAPEKDSSEPPQHTESLRETNINAEIADLKETLKEMESKLLHATIIHASENPVPNQDNFKLNKTKDVEIAVCNDSHLLKKIEEWKQEESSKYQQEINKLRTQMMESINAIKNNEINIPNTKESLLIEQLNKTINQQGEEIMKLKDELTRSDTKAVIEEANRKDVEAKVVLWTQKVEEQSLQYKRLMENLNAVAKEAQEARALAEAESRLAASLQAQLTTNNQNDKIKYTSDDVVDYAATILLSKQSKNAEKVIQKPKSTVNRNSLEELHRKAQELLNIRSSSSSDSSKSGDAADAIVEKNPPSIAKPGKIRRNIKYKNNIKENIIQEELPKIKVNNNKKKVIRSVAISNSHQDSETKPPKSPQKVVRAKLTEEVNSRLVAAGVDPLKKGVNKSIYNKQCHQLHLEQQAKIKENASYEKIRNSLLVYLDSKARQETKVKDQYLNPTVKTSSDIKTSSLTSMISNVKHKALSLVKSDVKNQYERKQKNAKVENKAPTKSRVDSGSQNPASSSSSPEKSNISDYLKINQQSESAQHHYKKKKTNLFREVTSTKPKQAAVDDTVSESEHDDYDTLNKNKNKFVEKLIKSPIRRPATVSGNYNEIKSINADQTMNRTHSAINISQFSPNKDKKIESDSDLDATNSRNVSEENIQVVGPKGVLKNAPSTASLNKKKVIFDLDAIQMKSVSASPSQSTEKSDEKFELGLVNLDDEEWDISSIDNELVKNNDISGRISVSSRASPKIAELKESIESQLARRNPTSSTMTHYGGVDVLRGPLTRAASVGGSNTSLGSSVFDDTDNGPHQPTSIKTKNIIEKDDSDLDLSEFSIDGVSNKKKDSF